jgi:hypothetical protein
MSIWYSAISAFAVYNGDFSVKTDLTVRVRRNYEWIASLLGQILLHIMATPFSM